MSSRKGGGSANHLLGFTTERSATTLGGDESARATNSSGSHQARPTSSRGGGGHGQQQQRGGSRGGAATNRGRGGGGGGRGSGAGAGSGGGGARTGGGGGRGGAIEPEQQQRAALIQRFQFIVSREDMSAPALRHALMDVDAPPPWSIVKYVAVRSPLDDFTCPICLEPPVAACASVGCGHVYCLKCLYALAVHGWLKEQSKRSPGPQGGGLPPPPPSSASPPAGGGLLTNGLTERNLGSYVRGGCPMCSVSLTLRGIVPVLHIPTATVAKGSELTFAPVAAVVPMPLTVFGTEEATLSRICVESDSTFAWCAQQAVDIAGEVEQCRRDIGLAEARLAELIDQEAHRSAVELEQAASRGSMATSLFAATRASRPPPDTEEIKEARNTVRSAMADADAAVLAQNWFADLLRASEIVGGDLTTDDLDVFAVYGPAPSSPIRSAADSNPKMPRTPNSSGSARFGPFDSGCQDTTTADQWTYQAISGEPLYLDPVIVQMLVDTALGAAGTPPAAGQPQQQQQRGGAVSSSSGAAAGADAAAPPPVSLVPQDGFASDDARDAAATLANRSPQKQPAADVMTTDGVPLPVALLPKSVTVRVAEIDIASATRGLRHHNKALASVPLGGKVSFVAPSQIPGAVSRATRAKFKRTVEAQMRRRQERERREKDHDARAQQREQEQMRRRHENDLGRHVYAVPAAQYFFGPESTGDSGQRFTDPTLALAALADCEGLSSSGGETPSVGNTPPLGPAQPMAWSSRSRNLLADDAAAPTLDALAGTPPSAAASPAVGPVSSAPPPLPMTPPTSASAWGKKQSTPQQPSPLRLQPAWGSKQRKQ